MAVFLCRWPNGDISIVSARNKDDAIVKLDEIGNADHADLKQLRELLVDFTLKEDGGLELSDFDSCGFGERTIDEIMQKAYPMLEETFMSDELHEMEEGGSEYQSAIRKAVEAERERLKGGKKKIKEPKTELGKEIQRQTGAPTVMIDRITERVAKENLKKLLSGEPKP